MNVTLNVRTADTVRIYFERANTPEIKKVLPQKAKTLEEALADFEKTLLPEATSFGQTIYADGQYVGDVWCYCIDLNEEPNCMVSYCIFEPEYRSKGVATAALGLFLEEIQKRFGVKSVGAFTYTSNEASIKVLLKNEFTVQETFAEDGVMSQYLQRNFAE